MASSPHLFPTDLTDAEWAILAPLIPAPRPGGRPLQWTRRAICNAVFYLARSGCHWRLLTREFPPWQTVYAASSEHWILAVYRRVDISTESSAAAITFAEQLIDRGQP